MLANPLNLTDSQLLDYDRWGWLGPLPVLNQRECSLLNSHLDSSRRPAPLDWRKGLAASDRVVYDIASSPRITSLVRSVLKDNIVLWGAHVVTREPGKSHCWHTDIETATSTGNALTVWIGLENTSVRSSLGLIAGSHRLGIPLQQAAAEQDLSRDKRDDATSFAMARAIADDCALVQTVVTDGQALLFDGRLWHGSLNLQEQTSRRALLLQFARSDLPLHIPDLTKLDWPFKFKTTPRPPVILMSGKNPGKVNRIVSPPAQWPHSSRALANKAYTIPRSLQQDPLRGWRPTRFFAGSSPVLRKLSCHASILEPGCSPHVPHSHYDEELLIVLDGEAELIIANSAEDPAPRVERVGTGDLAYYPACQFHTIRGAGRSPVSYLMFRWNAPLQAKDDALEHAVYRNFRKRDFDAGRPWATSRVFEGRTDHLDKLHLHFSRVRKSGGYAEHRDEYDVAILLLEGAVATLGRTLQAPAVIFHPARALHGLRGISDEPALYLVVEFHGRYIDATTAAEKLRWQVYSLGARIRQAVRWRLQALTERLDRK